MTRAQWTTDLGKNTQITPTGLAFDENEVATNKDGVTYVFFITNMNGTLGMRLQIIDKDGNKVMERGGKSSHRKPTKCGRPTTSIWLSTKTDRRLSACRTSELLLTAS